MVKGHGTALPHVLDMNFIDELFHSIYMEFKLLEKCGDRICFLHMIMGTYYAFDTEFTGGVFVLQDI